MNLIVAKDLQSLSDDKYDNFNTNFTVHYWLSLGAPREKLVMGMAPYGQTFTLDNEAESGLNAQASLKGEAGEFTQQAGFLAYHEICRKVNFQFGWEVVKDPEGRMGPFAHKVWLQSQLHLLFSLQSTKLQGEICITHTFVFVYYLLLLLL